MAPRALAAANTTRPPRESATAFVRAAVEALEDIAKQLPAGMGTLEVALAARIRAACARLVECATRLAEDELMVAGSMGRFVHTRC